MKHDYDIIVIGAGHAGIEAALAPARMGLKTAASSEDTSAVSIGADNGLSDRPECKPSVF